MVKPKEPVAEQWYPLNLGSTCFDNAPTRFYSLRYEFKPASIDVSRPGTLHNSAENKVSLEFFNNQPGKSKVGFQGNSEECKELDAVLFFDGKSFRIERMYRAVKSLRHIRQPGESSAAAQGLNAKENDPEEEANANGVEKIPTSQASEKPVKKPPATMIQRERIDSEDVHPVVAKAGSAGAKKSNKKPSNQSSRPKKSPSPAPPVSPPDRKRERDSASVGEEKEDQSPAKKAISEEDVEVEELVEELIEYEEVSEDEEEHQGGNEAETSLKAQGGTGGEEGRASSSSSSSGSSGSGSSSSDSGSDEEDTASSADDGNDL